MSAADINALHTQSGGLHALLWMLYEASCDLDYASDNVPAVAAANRVSSLIILARDEAERLAAGIGECCSSRKSLAKPNPVVAAPVTNGKSIIDPAKLSIDQMFALFNALGTVGDVMDGLLCQPKFTCKNDLDEAGKMLDQLRETISDACEAIRAEAAARPVGDGDLSRRVFFAAEEWTDGSCNAEPAVKGLTTALTRLTQAKPTRMTGGQRNG